MKAALFTILVSLFLFTSCKQEYSPTTDRDAVFRCNNSEAACVDNFVLEMSARLNSPLPANHEIKIDGETLYDSCTPNEFDRKRVQTRINGVYLEMIYKGYSGKPRVDLEIINRGAFCTSFITLLNYNDISLQTVVKNGITYFGLVASQN